MRRRRQKIAAGLYAGIIILILVAMFIVSYTASMQRLRSEADGTNRAYLNQVIQSVDARLASIDLAVINIGFDLPIRVFMEGFYPDAGERARSMQTLQSQLCIATTLNPEVRSIWVYSADQQLVISESSMDDAHWFPDHEFLVAAMDATSASRWTGLRTVPYLYGDLAAQSAMVSLVRSYPLSSRVGFQRGLIIANVDATALQRAVAGADQRAAVLVMDGTGTAVFATGLGGIGPRADGGAHDGAGRNVPDALVAALAATDRAAGPHDIEIAGEAVRVFSGVSRTSGWRFFSLVPRAQFDSGLISLRNALIVAAGGLVFVGVIAVLMVTRWGRRPVARLVREVAQAAMAADPQIPPAVDDIEDVERYIARLIQEQERLKGTIERSLPALRWQIVVGMFMGTEPSVAVRSRCETLRGLGVKLSMGAFRVFVVEIDNFHERNDRPQEGGRPFLVSMLSAKADQLLAENDTGISVELWNGRIGVLAGYEQPEHGAAQLTSYATADAIRQFALTALGCTVTIGCGSVVGEPEDIAQSYREALKCLEFKTLAGNDAVITLEDVELPDERDVFRLYAQTDAILGALRLGNGAAMVEKVNNWFDEAVRLRLPPDSLRQLVLHLLLPATGQIDDATARTDVPPLPHQFDSLEELRDHIVRVLTGILERRSGERAGKHAEQLVTGVTAYIREHYSEPDLSLGSIAELFKVSASHLSKVFKEVTGKKFLDFLISVRIENAKQLLATDLRIADVGGAVGYSNAHSFLRIFKQSCGMTPGDYRLSLNLQRLTDG